jgi:peptide/nickel transport system permease protein
VKDETPGLPILSIKTFAYIDELGNEIIAYEINETIPNSNQFAELSPQHLLGTDNNGYDLFTNLMLGGRISLTIGFVVVILETILGVLLGGLAGYFGGWVDNVIMRIVDILSCIPSLPILLVLSVVFTENNVNGIEKLYYMMGILSLMGWTGTARLVRGQILSLREQEFMLAAKCSGLSTSRKIFKHLLPNVLPQLIVSMTLGLGSIILTEATLGYLGLGAPLGTATWGALINTVTKGATWNFWVPAGVCITLAILAFNFVGDGLRDAFDPKMKR